MTDIRGIRPPRGAWPMLFLLALALVSGCGAGKGDVTGQVSYKGKSLACGTVSILGTDGLLRHGNIMADGSYIVYDVPAGPAKVAVTCVNPEHEYLMTVKLQMNPESAAAIPKPDPEIVKKWFPISESYQVPETSGLECVVKRGMNEHNITLDRASEAPPKVARPATGQPTKGIGGLEKLPPGQ